MKKAIIISCSVIIFLCLFTALFQWRFKPSQLSYSDERPKQELYEELMSELEDDNAAKYYLKASQSVVSTDEFGKVFDTYLLDPEYTGLEDEPGIEELFDRNEPALDLIREGTKQDFFSIPSQYPSRYYPFLAELRRVARLSAMRGALHEKSGELEKATDLYLDLLRFGNDISSLGYGVFAAIGNTIEGSGYYRISSLTDRMNDEEACRRLMEEMILISGERASLHDSLETVFSDVRRDYDERDAEAVLYRGGIVFDYTSYSRKHPDKAWRKFMGTYEPESIFEYFTDTADRAGWYMWFQLTKPMRLREMDRIHGMILEASKDSYHRILSAGIDDKVSKSRIAQRWFRPTYNHLKYGAGAEVDRRVTVIRLALRIHFLRNGEYPEALEELAPLAPDRFFFDPYSARRFKYKRTKDGYLLYSFGPDLDDDGGEGVAFRGSWPEDCDIVFDQSGSVGFMAPPKKKTRSN